MKIFLVGFMGSGKTYWGKIWSEKSGLPFFDLDSCIEKRFSMPVSEIFRKKGEEEFRKAERDELRNFKEKQHFILSCGGGAPCYFQNMEWMKNEGIVIYLKADPGSILQRLQGEIETRPLLQNVPADDLPDFIKNKLSEREPVYFLAQEIWQVGGLSAGSIMKLL